MSEPGSGSSAVLAGGAETREAAGELLPLGLRARQLGLEALDLGVLVFERLPEGVALGARVARRRLRGAGAGVVRSSWRVSLRVSRMRPLLAGAGAAATGSLAPA